SIKNVRAELAPPPTKPEPPSSKDPLTELAESIQKIQKLDFPLPVDLSVMVDVAPINIEYRSPLPKKSLQLHDFSFRFEMPSLAVDPITANMEGRVNVDNRKVGKVDLRAKVSNLTTRERRIHIASALFDVESDVPGIYLKFTGGLTQVDGFNANCRIELPELFSVAAPFIPHNTPLLSGELKLLLLARADKNSNLQADFRFDASALSATGGAIGKKRVGPLDITLNQKITTDHLKETVVFSDGNLVIGRAVDASWSASVKRPTFSDRTLDVLLGPIQIDLQKTVSITAPFLPSKSPVREIAGEVFLRSMNLNLNGAEDRGTVVVSGLGVKLPVLKIQQKSGELKLEGLDILLDRLNSPLRNKLPTKLTADLNWSVKRALLSGGREISLQGGRGTFGLIVEDLDLKSKSPYKVTASAVVTQTLDLDHALIGTDLSLENIHKQVRLSGYAAEDGQIKAFIPEFVLKVGSLQGSNNKRHFGPVPISVAMTADGVKLSADKGSRPSLDGVSADVAIGNIIHLNANAALSATSPQKATSRGNITLDLLKATKFADSFLPSDLKAGGSAALNWNVAAPVPENGVVIDKNPLRAARGGFALCDNLELGLMLDNISAAIPLAKGTVRIAALNSKPGLRFLSTGKGELVSFDGGILLSGVSGLPGAAEKFKSQNASFLFNGELSRWSAMRLHEEFRAEPLAVLHEAELNIDRIDSLFDESLPLTADKFLKRLDATLFATTEAAFSREFTKLLSGVDLAGNFSGYARIDLTAGKELAIRTALKTRDFGAKLENGTEIEGMRSDLFFNRKYSLVSDTQSNQWIPLSASLVRPAAQPNSNTGAAGIVGRINEDLRGEQSGVRSFSIKRVTTKASGLPLLLTALEGDLLFTQEKTGLAFLQADLLGGTLLARGLIELKPEIPVFTAAGSFSDLDVTYLLPKELKKQSRNQDARITGEITLSAPLRTEQRELLEQLRLSANIRKIGADTIERALFTLDPYELNEQVVAQRKMLRLGSLKGLRATAVDGSFAIEGEAEIKGVEINLPRVERLRLSELSMRPELEKNRKKVMSLRALLELVRADTVYVGPNGEISLKRRSYEK
ncbi:MAG: hypothetical protein PHU01_12010, partial [Desulfuromonadaceae bacterium]|nr:hypothetical protein [Desulfuromonadaceae bacterium]